MQYRPFQKSLISVILKSTPYSKQCSIIIIKLVATITRLTKCSNFLKFSSDLSFLGYRWQRRFWFKARKEIRTGWCRAGCCIETRTCSYFNEQCMHFWSVPIHGNIKTTERSCYQVQWIVVSATFPIYKSLIMTSAEMSSLHFDLGLPSCLHLALLPLPFLSAFGITLPFLSTFGIITPSYT